MSVISHGICEPRILPHRDGSAGRKNIHFRTAGMCGTNYRGSAVYGPLCSARTARNVQSSGPAPARHSSFLSSPDRRHGIAGNQAALSSVSIVRRKHSCVRLASGPVLAPARIPGHTPGPTNRRLVVSQRGRVLVGRAAWVGGFRVAPFMGLSPMVTAPPGLIPASFRLSTPISTTSQHLGRPAGFPTRLLVNSAHRPCSWASGLLAPVASERSSLPTRR